MNFLGNYFNFAGALSKNLSEHYLSAVVDIWGDTPFLLEPEVDNHIQ